MEQHTKISVINTEVNVIKTELKQSIEEILFKNYYWSTDVQRVQYNYIIVYPRQVLFEKVQKKYKIFIHHGQEIFFMNVSDFI